VQVVDRIDRRILRSELRGARLECLRVARRPPVAKISESVGLSALVVEAWPISWPITAPMAP